MQLDTRPRQPISIHLEASWQNIVRVHGVKLTSYRNASESVIASQFTHKPSFCVHKEK